MGGYDLVARVHSRISPHKCWQLRFGSLYSSVQMLPHDAACMWSSLSPERLSHRTPCFLGLVHVQIAEPEPGDQKRGNPPSEQRAVVPLYSRWSCRVNPCSIVHAQRGDFVSPGQVR